MRAVRIGVILFALCVAGCESSTAKVTSADFGDAWPLTVSEGVLSCDQKGPRKAVFFFVGPDGNGQMYAVNGQAKDRGAPSIEPIWRTTAEGGRINIGPLIERGLTLCR